MFQTVPARRIQTLVTDARADAAELDSLRTAGVEVRVVELDEQRL
jgi:hypothetical protein